MDQKWRSFQRLPLALGSPRRMPLTKSSAYGSWKSPITSDLIVRGSVALSQPTIDGQNIYWIEMRPSEGGRNVIVKREPSGTTVDLTPPGFNARTRVHEYGGGDYSVNEGVVYFSQFADQRLYVQTTDFADPQPLTSPGDVRYAESIVDQKRGLLFCVREDHRMGNEPVNTIVILRSDGKDDFGSVVASGNDFYSSAGLSRDGKQLAWLTWNHPNMPWDGTELWMANVKPDGSLSERRLVAGGADESIVQPEWSPDGTLYFVSDRSGWWNLHRLHGNSSEVVYESRAEFALPQWLFRMSSYAFESSGRIVCSFIQNGSSHLAIIDTADGKLTRIDSPYTDVSFVRAAAGRAVFHAASPTEVPAIVMFNLDTGEFEVLRRSSEVVIDRKYFSIPQAVEFPTEKSETAHAFFYRPQNGDYGPVEGEFPPLIVKSHGGPTAATTTSMSLSTQFWTSRGFAVLDVNYGGSTGYGRAYRDRLRGAWGVVDVDDCVNGARFLVDQGMVDPKRLIITGGSAGGYTTLCALTFRDVFNAGASHFGVSDAEALARETHKFESRYLDRLIGPYPEERELYFDRSPVNFADRLSCPVIFFQGLEDKIVTPNQAELMVDVLKRKEIPVAYVAFAGEQHGFRQAKNIKRALDGELYFYSRVFGFELADETEPVEIWNL
jgi:dipeptidyl aminopeptidase/acylaminoacyl peptidase